MTPSLLVDVDGVLNPLGEPKDRPGRVPPASRASAARRSYCAPTPSTAPGCSASPTSTTWPGARPGGPAIDKVAPLAGLPVGLPAALLSRPGRESKHRVDYKAPHVRRFANGRPAARIDDALLWVENDFRLLLGAWHGLTGEEPPVEDALLLQANRFVGLEQCHVATPWP